MKIIKIQKWAFCEKIFHPYKFSPIMKDKYCYKRDSKITILEYFNIKERQLYSKPDAAILKEILEFINSEKFSKEFKYSLSNENRIFKFYLLNLSLINNRIGELGHKLLKLNNYQNQSNKINSKNLISLLSNKNRLLEYYNIFKLRLKFNYFPLHYIYDNFYKEYTKKYFLKNSFNEVFEEKFFKKLKLLDIKYLKYRDSFAKDLNSIDEEIEAFFHNEMNHDKSFKDLVSENLDFKKKYEAFLKKYFISFIFEIKPQAAKSKSNPAAANKKDDLSIYATDIEKLFTYFLAHVKINFFEYLKI